MSRPVSTARNRLVQRALATNCTHVLWLDGDVAFHADAIVQLLRLDVDVACLAYLARPNAEGVRTSERSYSVCLTDLEQEPVRGTVRVDHSGFGALLMRREVLTRLTAAHPELACRDNYGEAGDTHALFAELIEDGVRYSEDVSFCKRWAGLGGAIHVLLDADTSHGEAGIGNYARDVWDHRVELAAIREELIRIDQEGQALKAELLGANDPALSHLIAMVPTNPRGRLGKANVDRSPDGYRPVREGMTATVALMRDEVARRRARPAPAPVVTRAPSARRLEIPANRRAPCPCGSGQRFSRCHGAATRTLVAPAGEA